MNFTKICPVRDFVHADLYCRECPDKPKPKIKTGTAYIFKKYGGNPVDSFDVESKKGLQELTAMAKFFDSRFKMEFIES